MSEGDDRRLVLEVAKKVEDFFTLFTCGLQVKHILQMLQEGDAEYRACAARLLDNNAAAPVAKFLVEAGYTKYPEGGSDKTYFKFLPPPTRKLCNYFSKIEPESSLPPFPEIAWDKTDPSNWKVVRASTASAASGPIGAPPNTPPTPPFTSRHPVQRCPARRAASSRANARACLRPPTQPPP